MVGVLLISLLSTVVLGWLLVKWLLPWLPGDLYYLKLVGKMVKNMKPMIGKQLTMADKLEEMASTQPNKAYLLFEDEVYSYKDMYEWMIRVTRALHELGIEHGDEIALMMNNEPAYVAILLGAMRLGVTTALINHNQRSTVLQHSFSLLNTKLVIVGEEEELLQAVQDIRSNIDLSLISYTSEVDGRKSFKDIVDKQSSDPLEDELKPSFPLSDTAIYINTSGTTGRPKAVKISFSKVLVFPQISLFFSCRPDDVIYCALPFYHTAGCMAGLMCALNAGVTIAVRRRFSASNCMKDCIKYNVTVLQYIGETMRYICMQPPSPYDRKHMIRVAYGNGLRRDVWNKFKQRFGSEINIFEFYASTEGNASFVNLYNIPGAVGVCSPLIKAILKVSFVRCDLDEGIPYRDSNGRCIEVSLNEPGLIIRKVSPTAMHCDYKGSKELTEKKLIRDVFEKGDCYYNSGDLLIRDSSYAVYFCDRLGDTFRWKGENVSTNEVADVINSCPDVSEATVYGVKVKGMDGRAGMAALTLNTDEPDLTLLYSVCKNNLPKYAIPLFIRILKELDHTSTMKLSKVKLKEKGFDIDDHDLVYFFHPQHKSYLPLTKEIILDLENGLLKI